jgi:membrane associated rhomboid family serine protease
VIIPLGTDRSLRRPPVITWTLLGMNTAIFLTMAALARTQGDAAANNIMNIFQLRGEGPAWHTFITYQFLHAGFLHLLGNMLTLWVFGPNVEDRFGRFGFIGLYLGTGVLAGLAHVLFERAPVVGASGAIAGITGAYLVLFPRTSIKIFYFFLLIGIAWIPAWMFIVFAIAKDFVLTGLGWGGNVATLAHLGGYATGFGVSMLLLSTRVIQPEGWDLFSITRQAKRRQDFRAAAEEAAANARRTQRGVDNAMTDALATARAAVTKAAQSDGDLALASAYANLLKVASGPGTRAALPPKTHVHMTMRLLQGDAAMRSLAADALESFAAAYPRDPQSTAFNLLLASIALNDLNSPPRATSALAAITSEPTDPGQRTMLADLRARLQVATPAPR